MSANNSLALWATVALLISSWATGALAQTSGAQAAAPSTARWREDLRYLARELPRRHANAFHSVTRERFERAVAELDAAIPMLPDYQIIVRMLQLTALIGDGHTYVHLPPTFKRYPIGMYWFGNELRVISATADYRRALGARVLRIGEVDIATAQERLLSVISHAENQWFVLRNSPAYMARPEVLRTLGIVSDTAEATFAFEHDAGERFTLDLIPVGPEATLTGLEQQGATPLYRQRPTEQFWFAYLPEAQTVYVSFRSYNSFGENARRLLDFIDRNQAKRLVIDIRQNTGGDFTKVRRQLVPELRRRPALARRGGLYIITGRRTFSAAMVNAIDFRREVNAILVGEPPGARPNGYQENDEMRLPNSRLEVSYSTRLYRFQEGDATAVMPDRQIEITWEAYRAGRDPVMEWILAQPLPQ